MEILNKKQFSRRSLLKAAIALGMGLILPIGARPKYTIKIVHERCVGCKDCQRVCPVDAIRFRQGKAIMIEENCNECLLCAAVCSYGAIRKCLKEKEM